MGAINRVQSKKKYVKRAYFERHTAEFEEKQLPLGAEKWHFWGKTGWLSIKGANLACKRTSLTEKGGSATEGNCSLES